MPLAMKPTASWAGQGAVGIGYEQQRLTELGHPELFQRLDWVSDTRGDGAGFDILSFEEDAHERFIEVKTTNGGVGSSFLVSHNELEFSKEAGDQFHLYRVFQFRDGPRSVHATRRPQPTCASQADGLPGEFPEFGGVKAGSVEPNGCVGRFC